VGKPRGGCGEKKWDEERTSRGEESRRKTKKKGKRGRGSTGTGLGANGKGKESTKKKVGKKCADP